MEALEPAPSRGRARRARPLERYFLDRADLLLEILPAPRRPGVRSPARRAFAEAALRRDLALLAGRARRGGARPSGGAGGGRRREAPTTPRREPPGNGDLSRPASLSILVVEDDALALKALAQALRARGFDVVETPTGRGALDELRERAFGAVVLDLRLPDMDGMDVLRTMKSDPATRTIPVVILTAVGIQERARAFGEGCEEFLMKPPDVGELAGILAQLRAAPVPALRLVEGGNDGG